MSPRFLVDQTIRAPARTHASHRAETHQPKINPLATHPQHPGTPQAPPRGSRRFRRRGWRALAVLRGILVENVEAGDARSGKTIQFGCIATKDAPQPESSGQTRPMGNNESLPQDRQVVEALWHASNQLTEHFSRLGGAARYPGFHEADQVGLLCLLLAFESVEPGTLRSLVKVDAGLLDLLEEVARRVMPKAVQPVPFLRTSVRRHSYPDSLIQRVAMSLVGVKWDPETVGTAIRSLEDRFFQSEEPYTALVRNWVNSLAVQVSKSRSTSPSVSADDSTHEHP